jgi:hypothetical protein
VVRFRVGVLKGFIKVVALQLCIIEDKSQSLLSIVHVFATEPFFIKSKII